MNETKIKFGTLSIRRLELVRRILSETLFKLCKDRVKKKTLMFATLQRSMVAFYLATLQIYISLMPMKIFGHFRFQQCFYAPYVRLKR